MQTQRILQHSHWLSRSLTLLFCFMVGLVLPVRPAEAATITVTTTADSGPGSLRQAIADAAWGDTITFALPNPSTITLNYELVIAKHLTIQGPGAAALTISGPTAVSAPTRLFFINPGGSSATSGPPVLTLEVTIANLTLANGYARGVSGNAQPGSWVNMGGGGGGGAGMGGAIFSNKSALTIRGVTFRANRAQGGTSGSNVVPNQTAPGFGGGGMGSPSFYGAYYGVDGGALGGQGGAVADGKLEGQYPNGSLGPIGYPGGEGAGGGGGYPNKPSPGGVGGFGGGGGGGGGLTDRWYGSTGGPGGAGGFGGGGGGGGGLYQQYGGRAAGGAGGQFGGKGGTGGLSLLKGAPGGGGAGLGGAIFVRAGTLTLIDSSFLNNSATGGQGYPEVFADPGQGKGGAIFILTTYNGQPTGASLAMSGCATFSGNSAANATGSGRDTHDLYGVDKPALAPCGGVVSVWGDNTYGQLNLPAGLSGVTKIATGYRHTLALKNDGTVVAWGYNAYGQSTVPAGLTGVIALAAGDRHSLALKSDGTVVAWGENSQGQLNIPAGLTNVTAIASGPYHNLALKADGTVVGWGGNEGGQLNIPAGLNNVTAIATGMAFAVALKSDGTVVAWGNNTYKQLNMPAGLSGIKAIATGRLHTLALKQDNTVVAWGYTCCYQIAVPAGLNNVSALAGGGYHSLALKRDGTVVSWGDNSAGQRNQPAGLSGVGAMSAGGFHTVLLSQESGFQGISAANAVVAAADATAPNSELPVMEEAPEAMGAVESSEPAPAATPVEAEVAPTQPPVEAPAEAPAPPAPTENNGSNQIFLPIIANLAGTALGTPGGLALLALVVVVIAGLVWQRRVRKH